MRKESWEPRQAQDLVRSRPDRQQVDDPRDLQAARFLATNEALEAITGVQVATNLAIPQEPSPARRLKTSDDDFLIVER